MTDIRGQTMAEEDTDREGKEVKDKEWQRRLWTSRQMRSLQQQCDVDVGGSDGVSYTDSGTAADVYVIGRLR